MRRADGDLPRDKRDIHAKSMELIAQLSISFSSADLPTFPRYFSTIAVLTRSVQRLGHGEALLFCGINIPRVNP